MGKEVRISRLGLKPAPSSEKADIGSTGKSTDIRHIASSWTRPGARSPPACAISAENSAPLAHSPMYILYLEQLVLNKTRPRRIFRGPGVRRGTRRPQIDRGSGREVFSSTSQRNTGLRTARYRRLPGDVPEISGSRRQRGEEEECTLRWPAGIVQILQYGERCGFSTMICSC